MQTPQKIAEGFLMIMRSIDAIIYICIGFVNEKSYVFRTEVHCFLCFQGQCNAK